MKREFLYIAAVALIFTACSKQEDPADSPEPQSMVIGFNADVEQNKAGLVYNDFVVGDVLGVMGYEVRTSTWQDDEYPTLMHNASLTKQDVDGAINYVYNPQKYWSDAPYKARFFGYYPHSSAVESGTVTPSPITTAGYPYVTVVLGGSKQPIDFLAAQTALVSNNDNANVKLAFKHQLSKLIFKVKATGLGEGLNSGDTRKMYINALMIKNIQNKAVFQFDGTAAIGQWRDHSTEAVDATSGATINTSSIFTEVGTDWQDLLDPRGTAGQDSYLLMIPQQYDNVELSVISTIERLNPNGGCEDHIIATKRIPLSVNWEAGKVYTYYIEFAFSEVKEGDLILTMNVQDWVTGHEINTEIGN